MAEITEIKSQRGMREMSQEEVASDLFKECALRGCKVIELRNMIIELLEYEPTREDFGPLKKHDLQFESARALFQRARDLIKQA